MTGLKQQSRPVTLGVLSSNHLVRLGLQQIIGTTPHIQLAGHAKSIGEATELIRRHNLHVMIVDMEPECDIPGLIPQLREAAPSAKIILLSSLEEKERTREAFLAGVDGIVLKIQPPAVLLAVIEYLCQTSTGVPGDKDGETAVTQVERSRPAPSSSETIASRGPAGLTEREREVIVLIGQGLSNKDIADRLCISVITVRHHLTSIFDKLGVTTRQKLLIRAHQYGLVELTASA